MIKRILLNKICKKPTALFCHKGYWASLKFVNNKNFNDVVNSFVQSNTFFKNLINFQL